jgi:hypothetical protein
MDDYRAAAGEDQCYTQTIDCLHVTPAGLSALQSAGHLQADRPGALSLRRQYAAVTYHGGQCLVADGRLVAAGLPLEVAQAADGTWRCRAYARAGRILSAGPGGHVHVVEAPWRMPDPSAAAGPGRRLPPTTLSLG